MHGLGKPGQPLMEKQGGMIVKQLANEMIRG